MVSSIRLKLTRSSPSHVSRARSCEDRRVVGWDSRGAHHSKSLYMMVKNTCRKRLTAFISTAKRYSHASPDILSVIDRSPLFNNASF
jgi:hypothetical protein